MKDSGSRRDDTRSAVVEGAARLLREQGPAGVTTRAVAEAAGVQAPTIYRLFGDKDGLLDAVAEHVMHAHAAAKAVVAQEASAQDVDPLEDIRSGWRSQIEFGLANPAIFRLLSDPDRVRPSPAAESGRRVLAARVHRMAAAGLLRVDERRAADLLHAAGVGAVHTLLEVPPHERDAGLAEDLVEAVLRRILVDRSPSVDASVDASVAGDRSLAAAVAFRAVAPHLGVLSPAERQLQDEWLDRTVEALSRRDPGSQAPAAPSGV